MYEKIRRWCCVISSTSSFVRLVDGSGIALLLLLFLFRLRAVAASGPRVQCGDLVLVERAVAVAIQLLERVAGGCGCEGGFQVGDLSTIDLVITVLVELLHDRREGVLPFA